jgi:flagellar motor protein MotB
MKLSVRSRTAFVLSLLLLATSSSSYSQADEDIVDISETIFFMAEDADRYIRYKTARSNADTYSLLCGKDRTLKEVLEDYFYVYPNEYHYDTTKYADYNRLVLHEGNYATLAESHLGGLVQEVEGVYTYQTDDTESFRGHYGFWTSPDDFDQYVHVWVFPEKFEILSYECNREGDWVKRHNTISYFGEHVNDLLFSIKFKVKESRIYREVAQAVQEEADVEVRPEEGGARITLSNTLLFRSGSTEISQRGLRALGKIADYLNTQANLSVVVCGHTDDNPIHGKLKEIYHTNWELSAARALQVLHTLAGMGCDQSRCEISAFGEYKPNEEKPADKSLNRRVEIYIREEA